jgi:hypothetical protein
MIFASEQWVRIARNGGDYTGKLGEVIGSDRWANGKWYYKLLIDGNPVSWFNGDDLEGADTVLAVHAVSRGSIAHLGAFLNGAQQPYVEIPALGPLSSINMAVGQTLRITVKVRPDGMGIVRWEHVKQEGSE